MPYRSQDQMALRKNGNHGEFLLRDSFIALNPARKVGFFIGNYNFRPYADSAGQLKYLDRASLYIRGTNLLFH